MNWKRANVKINKPLNEYLEELITNEKMPNHMWHISVGTDSRKHGGAYKFATVILITVKEDLGGIIVGRGGKIIQATYFPKVHGKNKEGVNERMLMEVSKSIEVAYEIAPVLEKYGIKMEIHADINTDPRWESNKALNQAIGYILGMGYEFRVKPDSVSATYCADKACGK